RRPARLGQGHLGRRHRCARVSRARGRAEGPRRAWGAHGGDQGPVGGGTTDGNGEYGLDTPTLRAFVELVQDSIDTASAPEAACDAIRPFFAELLADPDWLPAEYRADAPQSGMGGGIGQWLLYRAEDGSLSLFSLVIPPTAETPVHDHLA